MVVVWKQYIWAELTKTIVHKFKHNSPLILAYLSSAVLNYYIFVFHYLTGYLNRPDATAATVDKDGWLHTGDVAYYDDNNNFFIVDRLKELIKYKGNQVQVLFIC